MLTASKILKWVTVLLLLGGVALLFAPYSYADEMGVSAIEKFRVINMGVISYTDAMSELLFSCFVPVVPTVLAGLIMIFKTSEPKTAIVVTLNGIALGIYHFVWSSSAFRHARQNVGWGLKGNVIVSGLGVILPLIVLILAKVGNRKAIKNPNP